MPVYGGDDISAIVLDAGSSSTRAGWAGEDTPRVVTPSYHGWLTEDQGIEKETSEAANGNGQQQQEDVEMQGVESNGNTNGGEAHENVLLGEKGEDGDERISSSKKKKAMSDWELQKRRAENRQRYVGDNGVNVWRKGMEIGNPFEDGILSSATSLLALARYSLEDVMGANPSEHPLLLTEPSWNSKEAREELTEVAFEGLDVPAFYLANSTVLSSFSAGKPSSLIVDIGASQASAVPVVDGFILRKGIQKQLGVGGDCISRALLYDLSTNPPSQTSRTGGTVDIIGQYLVKAKAASVPGGTSAAKLRDERVADTTESFKRYQQMRVLHEAKESLAQVLEEPWNEG
jgi:actin-related protein 4